MLAFPNVNSARDIPKVMPLFYYVDP